jgi:hypothetical protein
LSGKWGANRVYILTGYCGPWTKKSAETKGELHHGAKWVFVVAVLLVSFFPDREADVPVEEFPKPISTGKGFSDSSQAESLCSVKSACPIFV